MVLKSSSIVFLLSLLPCLLYTQDPGNKRTQIITSISQHECSDTLSIIPSTIQFMLNGVLLDTTRFEFDPVESKINYHISRNEGDTLLISYFVLPINISKPIYRKREKEYLQSRNTPNPFSYKADQEINRNPWANSSLQKNGSISRGISFGNNQNLSVSSNLNLQLSGKISEEVQILAAITDNNIPIQAEGNTQQLQDFDQVFVQLFNNKHKLIAGDYQLQEKNSYFLKYFKKAQGLSYQTLIPVSKDASWSTRISGAASRGKFARQIIAQQEGNQGPYRLLGAENELFIIILSGTERVYIDGELLTRGLDQDYTIDYNTAELIFTPKRLITKDKRIIVEFQYSDRSYVRTLSDISVEYNSSKISFYGKFYTEQDHKNQPVQEKLSNSKKQFLSNLGDQINQALYPSEDTSVYSPTRILYEKKDSLGYSILKYSTDSTKTLYTVIFSLVGDGKGHYIQTQTSANGKVFTWIAPDTLSGTLVLNGNYEPVELLITPKKRQMAVIGTSFRTTKNTGMAEIAFSNNDINTFSNLNSGDDNALAAKFKNEYTGHENTEHYFVKSGIQYEFIHRNFKEVEWFRNAEFNRDWNISSLKLKNNQHLSTIYAGLHHAQYGKMIEYNGSAYLSQSSEFVGIKHLFSSQFKTKHILVTSNGSVLNSKADTNSTSFWRHKSIIAYAFKPFVIGFKDDIERNLFFNPNFKTQFHNNSYEFIELEAFIRQPDSSKNDYSINYIQRTDKHVVNQNLIPYTKANNVQAGFDLFRSSNFTVKGRSTYRVLNIIDADHTNLKPENTLLNRIEYSWKFLKNTLQLSSFYELGSGVEARREYSFIEVAAGQGNFTWVDYNSNGIRELNEFETAVFQDQANYIKLFTPTTQYIQTKNNQFNQTLFFQPDRVLKNSKEWYKFINVFSNQLSYKIDWKTVSSQFHDYYNPFQVQIGDTNLIGLNNLFRNSCFIYRTDPVKGFTVNYQSASNKLLSNNGFEYKKNEFWEGLSRYNILAKYLLELRYLHGKKHNTNDFFTNRNFNIDYFEWEPKISVQWNNHIRTNMVFKYSEKNNAPMWGGERLQQQTIQSENRWSIAGKTNLDAQLSYILIHYQSNTDASSLNNSVSFEMLQGLKPGQNFTWNIGLVKTLENNIQITLQYNGRKSENSKTIHVGTAEVRAFF